MDKITLSYGSGGTLTHELVVGLFAKAFGNKFLAELDDAAVLNLDKSRYAFTTDSFVVDPLFFPGGDIGKLSVCGTVNDLASCGAQPKYLSAGFILEEGLPFKVLERVVLSMAGEAKKQNVLIVTGDTKVVPFGKADKIFINTAGIGLIHKRLKISHLRPGDKILINGPIAQHGLSVLLAREKFSYQAKIESDCNSLWGIVELLLKAKIDVRFMRDPTRGGLSAATNEIASSSGYSLLLREKQVPVNTSCRNLCDILGLEALDIANEGKMLVFVAGADASKALKVMKKHPLGRHAALIGEVLAEKRAKVYLETAASGKKIVSMPVTEPLPRIC